MEDLAADFIIENNSPIEFDAEISPSENFDCSFEIFASGTTWGSISGTLSNQTDLQNALDAKADKSEVESVTGALADSIQAVDNKYDSITSGLDDSITAIDNKYDSITGALDDKIDSINGALGDDIDALESITSGLSDSISAIDSTIGGYGDIVNYNAADFATSIQGGKADTALQPNDNISELYNDAGYITSASLPTVNDGELTIKVNGSSIATFTANQGTDTIADITVPNSAAWGNITGTLSDQTDLQNALDAKVTNNATGTNALAIGNTSQSTAEGGVAVGYGARANSTYATAVGEDTRANNTNTTVIGRAAKATEARAIAIGSGAEANAQDAIAIKGINNTANTFQVYTYNMLDMSTGLIPDARISTNIARTVDIPTFNTTQMAAINSGANTTNIGQIATNTQDISDEITNRQNADNGLQSQIDALVVASDVFDIVGTYADLQAYDISTVPVNDIIKVLVDSTHNDAATYYRCTESDGVKSWTYIGSEGAYYTKGEADSKFALQTTTVNGHALSSNITLTASDVGALPDSTVIPTVNNSSITFQKNGTDFDTITLNQSSNDTINITVPTDTNDLTNGAGYITAASLPIDYYTKSEIDAILPQPTKVPIVYYQPTNSYCYTESNNRFYGSHVFEKLYLVQPKTSGTTQVIDMSTTFSLSFTIDYQKAPSSAVTVAEIMTSYSAGKGVLLQLNTTGLYYRNNITGTTITGTRALTAGNSYDVKAEYDGTHMIISYKLSSDANYTQINSTTCTCDGSNYNYAAIGMNTDNGNISLASVVLTNGADTLYSYTAGKIALDYDGSTLKLNASNQLSVDFNGYATESWVGNQGYLTSGDLTNYVTTNTAQTITAKKTFTGEKAILFKQTSNSDKLGFTLYNSSNTELGAFEYRPNTISGAALLNVNTSYANSCYVGFRYWGTAVNVIAPKPSTAGDYYIPINITDGNTTVTANNTGLVNISSLLPTSEIFVAEYDVTSYSDVLAAYNAGKYIYVKNGDVYFYLESSSLDGFKFVSPFSETTSSGIGGIILRTNNTWQTNGNHLLQDKLTAGSNITISGDTISATDTTYSDFTGADSVTAGTNGLVPAPSAGDDDKILTGGATWESVNTVIGYTPADNTLSNVSSIDGDSAVQTALNDKVNKSGDTMTGALTVQMSSPKIYLSNSDLTKGTNPASTKYIGLSFNDNTNSTTWQNTRLFNIEGALESNGTTHFYLQALKNEAGSTASAAFNLYMTQAGVASCSFPQTDCVDGQWVNADQQIISSATSLNGSTNLTYRVSLPNDGQLYEVMIRGMGYTGSTAGNEIYIAVTGNEDTMSRYLCRVRAGAAGTFAAAGTAIATCSYVSSTGKNLTVSRNSSWNGSCSELRVVAYRRIGTNT